MSLVQNPRFDYTKPSDSYYNKIRNTLHAKHEAKVRLLRLQGSTPVSNLGSISHQDLNRKITVAQVTKLRDLMLTALTNAVKHFAIDVIVNNNRVRLNTREQLLADPMSFVTRLNVHGDFDPYSLSSADRTLSRIAGESSALPAGTIMLTKSVLGTRSNSVYVPAVVQSYDPETGRYNVLIYRSHNAPPIVEQRRPANLHINYAMLIEFKGTVEACNSLISSMNDPALSTWAEGINVNTLVSVINLAGHMHIRGMTNVLNYNEYMVQDANSGAGQPTSQYHMATTLEMSDGVLMGQLWRRFKPVIFEGVEIPAPPAIDPTDYDKLLNNLRIHSRKMTKFRARHRFSSHMDSAYQFDNSAPLAHGRYASSSTGVALAKRCFVTYREQLKALGTLVGQIKQAAVADDKPRLRQLIKPQSLAAFFASRHILQSGTRRTHGNFDTVYNSFIELLMTAGCDANSLFICTDRNQMTLMLKSDAVQVISHYNGNRPSHIYMSPEDVARRCTMFNGVPHITDNMYRWSDGTIQPHPEPAAIVGYHESKRYVGYVPTTYKAPYLGMELEVEVTDGANRETVARQVRKICNTDFGMTSPMYLSCERDNSVSAGFEIVTGYTGLDTHAKHIKALLNANLKIANTGNAGLHVHICKKGASLTHMARMDQLINSEEFYPLMLAVARRAPNSYCTRESDKDTKRSMVNRIRDHIGRPPKDKAKRMQWLNSMRAIRNSVVHNFNLQRYSAINFHNENTMEFRIFKSSVKYGEVMAALEFTYMVWHFCQFASETRLNTEQFCKYISQVENRKSSVNLRNLLAENGFRVFVPNTNKKALPPKPVSKATRKPAYATAA